MDPVTTILRGPFDLAAQFLVIAYPPVFAFWFVVHGGIRYWRSRGKRVYWIACLAWPLISGPLFYFRSALFERRADVPQWAAIVGLALFLLAVILARQAGRAIPFRTLVGLPELQPGVHSQPLLRSGIYGRTRNPVYLVHTLLILSAALIASYVSSWVLVAMDAVLLPVMILVEEQELRSRYGNEYSQYCREVPRFFPRLMR